MGAERRTSLPGGLVPLVSIGGLGGVSKQSLDLPKARLAVAGLPPSEVRVIVARRYGDDRLGGLTLRSPSSQLCDSGREPESPSRS